MPSKLGRINPPLEWKFTGRTYPEGEELKVINIHAKWADLMWYDPSRDVLVYISTMPYEKYKTLQTKTGGT